MADKSTFLGHITNLHDELMVAIDAKEDEMHKLQNGHIMGHNQKLSDHEVCIIVSLFLVKRTPFVYSTTVPQSCSSTVWPFS
jgi:hypothetical protein